MSKISLENFRTLMYQNVYNTNIFNYLLEDIGMEKADCISIAWADGLFHRVCRNRKSGTSTGNIRNRQGH